MADPRADWILIDKTVNHLMQSHVRGDGYAYLAWPKNSTLLDLEWIREACNVQLDFFINHARRETEIEQAARLEVESWDCSSVPDGVKGTPSDGVPEASKTSAGGCNDGR